MSHTVKVYLIADQEIKILGQVVNIHDIIAIELDSNGMVKGYTLNTQKTDTKKG